MEVLGEETDQVRIQDRDPERRSVFLFPKSFVKTPTKYSRPLSAQVLLKAVAGFYWRRLFSGDSNLPSLSRKLRKRKLLVGGLGPNVCTCTSKRMLKVKVLWYRPGRDGACITTFDIYLTSVTFVNSNSNSNS